MRTETTKLPIDFGPDKSQILRGIAIIFMIILHNNCGGLFKICVPIFTFLVGYGYSFAKQKNLTHAAKRSWHLLSHFWLILLGVFLPVAIWTANYNPTVSLILSELFGLESKLNWFSWYVYFYIFAMIIMVPASRFIDYYKIWGVLILTISFFCIAMSIHHISGWQENIWLQAAFDCCIVSPPMFTGYYLANNKIAEKIELTHNWISLMILGLIALGAFFFRGSFYYASQLDFITVPIFCLAIVGIFNIIRNRQIHTLFISLGKESMNMWFFHAIFFTGVTSGLFYPLLSWIQPKVILIIAMIIVSYFVGKVFTTVYNILK